VLRHVTRTQPSLGCRSEEPEGHTRPSQWPPRPESLESCAVQGRWSTGGGSGEAERLAPSARSCPTEWRFSAYAVPGFCECGGAANGGTMQAGPPKRWISRAVIEERLRGRRARHRARRRGTSADGCARPIGSRDKAKVTIPFRAVHNVTVAGRHSPQLLGTPVTARLLRGCSHRRTAGLGDAPSTIRRLSGIIAGDPAMDSI